MNKLLIAAASLAIASAAVSNAAITGSWTTDLPLTGVFSGTWDNVGGTDSTTISGTHWSATLDAGTQTIGAFSVNYVSLEGYHLTAPHAGESPGNGPFLGAAVFTGSVGAGGTSFGSVPHGNHADTWDMMVNIISPTDATIDIKASHPVPEPSTYGLVAGLGLIGFGLYRRMKG